VRVQVLAPHFQTFGEDYEVDKRSWRFTVKLKHPGTVLVYDNHAEDKKRSEALGAGRGGTKNSFAGDDSGSRWPTIGLPWD